MLCAVAKDVVVPERVLSLLKSFLVGPFFILADGLALTLCNRRHDTKHQESRGILCRNTFLLKTDLYSMAVQHFCILQTVNDVAGEPGNTLDQNQIYLSIQSVLYHFLEPRTLLRICTGDAFIVIDPGIFPVRIALYEFFIVLLLDFKALFLIGAARTDPAVSRHSFFPFFPY